MRRMLTKLSRKFCIYLLPGCLLLAVLFNLPRIGIPETAKGRQVLELGNASIMGNLTYPLFDLMSPRDDVFNSSILDALLLNESNRVAPTFTITGKSICQRKPLALLILIPSTPDHRDRRNAIRQTWASTVYQDPSDGCQTQRSRLAFFFGDSLLNNEKKINIKQEAAFYKDIVVANFHDTYRNLSLKIGIGLSWVKAYCSHAPFVAKVDDDAFLNIDLLLSIIRMLPNPTLDFTLGVRNIHKRPPVLRTGDWGNSVQDFPFPYYPSYVVGYAYVLSKPAVRKINQNFHRFRVLANEDAFLNGVLAFILNITRFNSGAFSAPLNSHTFCDVVYNRFATFLVSTEKLPLVWESYHSKNCSEKLNL